jgi:hypothetical protein
MEGTQAPLYHTLPYDHVVALPTHYSNRSYNDGTNPL